MDARLRPLWRPLLRDRAVQREAFETQARIAHRLLSQQAVQHEAILATLVLLQAGASPASTPVPTQGLTTLYPQILAVDRRPPGQTWPDRFGPPPTASAGTAGCASSSPASPTATRC
jgi:hypothetical protein